MSGSSGILRIARFKSEWRHKLEAKPPMGYRNERLGRSQRRKGFGTYLLSVTLQNRMRRRFRGPYRMGEPWEVVSPCHARAQRRWPAQREAVLRRSRV